MWYRGKHRESWWKKHGLDILTAVGLFLTFYLPVAVMFLR